MSKQESDFGTFVIGFFFGAVLGGVVGLLFAPQSGEETRDQLRQKSIELSEQASERAEEARAKAEKILAEAREKIDQVSKELQTRTQELQTRVQELQTQVEEMSEEAEGAEVPEEIAVEVKSDVAATEA